ncbi:ATP-binding protein [Parasedimentitalea maritima]|uniref:Sensory/regulatory protein RpfC n=1 Tax=Parasedimentitalea maritima TaxID=2578117 RepID=A0A6A4RFN2_9RHOB|nr:ATP-binding protein [Zongyanglinia marina]KAE9630047.1 PAS domain-containing protein [Zongyanglinia marina]
MAVSFQLSSVLRALKKRTYLPAFVAFVVVVIAFVFAEKQNATIHNQNLRADVQNEAGMVVSRLKGQLGADLQLIRGLVAVLSTEPTMDQARFGKLAEQVISGHNEVRLVAVAPDLVVSLIYPVAGNEAAIGLDYNKNEAQRDAAYRVRDSGGVVLAGPVNLVQGGRGFIGRFPIYTGTGPQRRFFGILSAVIDVDTLYAESGVTDPNAGIELALIGHDGMGSEGALFFGDADIVDDNPIRIDIPLAQGSWQLVARPRGGWTAQPDNLWPLRMSLLIAGALILFPTILAGRLSAGRRSVIYTLKRRERELETLSRRLGVAVETSKIGIWEYEPASERLIWDQRMRSLYGKTQSPEENLIQTWRQRLHPLDRDIAIKVFESAQKKLGAYASDFRIVLPDGQEKHIRALGSVFADANGRKRIIGVNWDVSKDVHLREEVMRTNQTLQERNVELYDGQIALEQAHTELQTKQAELHRLSLVAKHASDSIILTDAEARIVWVNEAFTRVTGYSAEEAIGASTGSLLNGPKTDPAVIGDINDHLSMGQRFHTEILNYTKSGTEIWIDTNLVPILNEEGQVELIIGIERDITGAKNRERELAEAKLAAEHADRAKSEFLANMSHEIRTPMNGIIGMAGLLSEADLPDNERQFVDTIQDSSVALLKIINDILDLSRLEAGKLEISPTDFKLRHCVEGAIDLLRPKARDKEISLSVNYAAGLPELMHGDDGRLRQILVNLVGNAVKFTSQGGVTVNVGCAKNDPYRLLVEIEDTGIGISAEQAKHIFDRFSQADTATTRAFGGTGLGLTISSVLAERMGGEITLRSELGKGCCFSLSVQLAPAQGPLVKEVPRVDVPAAILADSLVLLAEDNKVNRLLINKYLGDQPLELIEATNGREAVTLCQTRVPDIVLMDMSMPELDGISATREIRALDIVQPTIVALTANAFESDRDACLAAGMDCFLSKPIKKAHLLRTLAALQAERLEEKQRA